MIPGHCILPRPPVSLASACSENSINPIADTGPQDFSASAYTARHPDGIRDLGHGNVMKAAHAMNDAMVKSSGVPAIGLIEFPNKPTQGTPVAAARCNGPES